MIKRSVYIVQPDPMYIRMFTNQGWDVCLHAKDADLIQFTGGEDVTPSFYGEGKHPRTGNNVERDKREETIFNMARIHNKPIAGICRGGQFVNVMCGGRMYQHVNNHACGTHQAWDIEFKENFLVTSTHHQMIRPTNKAVLIATANISTRREYCPHGDNRVITVMGKNETGDVEVCYYPEQNALCFQPHPEFGEITLERRYFHYIEDYLFSPKAKG